LISVIAWLIALSSRALSHQLNETSDENLCLYLLTFGLTKGAAVIKWTAYLLLVVSIQMMDDSGHLLVFCLHSSLGKLIEICVYQFCGG
jgi:hypothetical protein